MHTILCTVGDCQPVRVLVPSPPAQPGARVEGWALVRELRRTQQGSIAVVARVVFEPAGDLDAGGAGSAGVVGGASGAGGRWLWALPYEYRALKVEGRERVAAAQTELALGLHRDNALLDRSLLSLISSCVVNDEWSAGVGPGRVHTVALHDCWRDEAFLYSLLDYAARGDLHGVCARARTVGGCVAESGWGGGAASEAGAGLPESQLRRIFADVLATLHCLHSHGFAHRDVSTPSSKRHFSDVGFITRVLPFDTN